MTENPSAPTVVEPISDVYLQSLIMILNEVGDEARMSSIVLQTAGGMVRGTLISFSAWTKAWGDQLRAASGNAAPLVAELDQWIDNAYAELNAEHGDCPSDGLPSYLHLADVTIVLPDGNKLTAPLWRGPVHAVTGWTLGQAARAD
ncbi:hypothetical protein J7I98_22095 [Streptomyces sp. ISL-98]|uniref:hypothetical protein n=1 Tax=Streptomyces sp. ISL-98 TaxID=2819192 RepID=UPI001BE8B73C|nr:hypothetical protein [Streptomyces sp. ISL-98]MBT2508530.1 hypothetical protein [Streptomyces sp. ISL-98]